METLLDQAAKIFARARHPIAVTGAGASVESGIPDFRSEDGLWARYDPAEYATLDAFFADPDKVWKLWHELAESLAGVQPNPGHYALAELEALGRMEAVITQNIDNLHTAAGSAKVIEYHGNAHWIVCPACRTRRAFPHGTQIQGAPRCDCGKPMKPDVVLFGELIPPAALREADGLAMYCDLLLIVGTSATVYPAAQLPYTAKDHGAFIIECNIEETEFTGSMTDIFLEGPAGAVLPELVRRVRALLPENGQARAR